MSRKHLFAIVVLLGAAAVAGLLALTRTTTAATQAPITQMTAKSRSLDRLEASLRRSLAQQPPALPATRASSATRTMFVPSSAAAQTSTDEREDEHRGDERNHEADHEADHEGDHEADD